MITRRNFIAGALLASSVRSSLAAAVPSNPTGAGLLKVPLDHSRAAAGSIELGYEWAPSLEPHRPTVVLVADAQQFYVRPGAAADLQNTLFGPDLNVLALFGRASSRGLKEYIRKGGTIDWDRASAVLNVHQWIADLALAADLLALPADRLCLYGRSGGADLALRFVSVHPERAKRAYVQAAVVHDLAAQWGLSADHFWSEFAGRSPALANRLGAFVAAQPSARREAMLLLQRQNFYEPLDSLHDARTALVEAIIGRDAAAIARYRERYQLDSLETMRRQGDDLGEVRVHEFSRAYRDPRGQPAPLYPDIESIFYYSEPVTRGRYNRAVGKEVPDLHRLRVARTQLLIVAGRYDHTADYRAQVGLSALAPDAELLLLDDDHVFKRLSASGRHPDLLRGFFAGGLGSDTYKRARSSLAELRWSEIPRIG